MKAILFALSAILAVVTARGIRDTSPHLLGTRKCLWGPGFWCQNLTNAAECNSTKHCIKNVWTGMTVPEDRDSVCDICKEMVKEARDQLQSNQTQEDLKAVFEGSCKLMVIEPVVRECDRLVDQFIPELVETLASQMDPSVVCSVSGLCNSEKIDRYIKEYEELMKKTHKMSVVSLKNDQLEPDSCSGCYTIATHMTEKFQQQSKDHLAGEWLSVCGRLGSFSDACSSLVLVNFNTIYNHLRDNLNAKNVCHLTGQCAGLFHKHEDEDENIPQVEIRPLSSVGMVEVGDDLPCKLCEQLVGHLRDLLVANTTEAEFQKVLEGFCKETKSFSSECLSIVDQYYPEIYGFLTHGLNGNAVCEMAGICPLPGHVSTTGPLMPLLPEKSSEIGVRLFNQKKQMNVGENGAGTRKDWPKTEADEMQLPIERIETSFSFSMPNMDVKGQKTCKLCEYVLHYLQQVITNPATEDEVKKELDIICTKIPKTFEDTCEGFVQTYGDTIVAILAQEVDPSVVCPMIYVCPSKQALDAWEKLPKDLMLRKNVEDKPSCPLCLLAITQLENAIKNDRTEANIEYQLDRLCMHLPKDLTEKCTDLVKGYSKEIVQKLIDDIQPQEVCVYIQLCDPNASVSPAMTIFPMDKDGEIMTNEIPDVPADVPTYAVVKKKVEADEKCVLCELFMQYAEKALRNKSTKDEIKIIIHDVCKYMPHKYSQECNNFVDEYANLVIDLLSQEVSPQEVCALVGLCKEGLKRVLDSVAECAVCQALVSSIDTMLVDPKVDTEIETIVSKACNYIPASKQGKCTMMLEVYEQSIINLLKRGVNTKKICTEIALCSSGDLFAMSNKLFRDRRHDVYGTKYCTWGEAYWCASPTNAIECKAEKHCEQKLKGMSTSVPTQFLDESSVSRT